MDGPDNYKCGEIFITYQGKYCYSCIICREFFDSIEYYEDHYMVQHFETKELYGEDGESFPIKIEPITEHDLEFIKSEVNSENEEFVDFVDTEHFIGTNIIKSKQYQTSFQDSDDQNSDSIEANEIVVTIDDNLEQEIDDAFEPDVLEWNESDLEISIDETNDVRELDSNDENFNGSNVSVEKQNLMEDLTTCQICLVKYTNLDYMYHVFQHKENGSCPLCKKNVNNLNTHSKITHKNYLKNCNRTKVNQMNKKTESRKRLDKKEAITCKYCNKIFLLTSALEQHEHLHESRLLNCKFCNKSYKDLRFLRYHMRKHTGERPFKCQQCTAAFTTKDNLNTHCIYKHTTTYDFSCTYDDCDKKFKTKELRKRHIKNIHLRVLGYQCDICGQKFMTSSRLCVHRVKSHINPEEWPYKCEFCEKPFILQCKLREHINYHTGEKPFKCDFCDQSFMKRRSLNDHKKKHKT